MEKVMVVQFAKWGNSIALRIPAAFVKDIGAAEGKCADISVRDGKLVVVPVEGPVYDLDELLSQITDENIYEEISAGGVAVGNEF
jgi:antitoxin MazE